MARTTSELVAEIIEVDVDISLTPFITAANALVTELLVGKHDDERLELIERWLSAHFYTNRDPRPTDEKAGPVSAEYQSKVDLFLSTSHYGQMAIVLDTSGELAKLNNQAKEGKRTVSAHWLGKPLT